ncbi:MAG: hypothetical protein D6744_07760 [Planctomycetota bacterium]|nr:MAG: hypothetical protein D6744_07760 [Planctomycetota bacterium]
MKDTSARKERLHRLIDFARAYRGWSRVRTAKALGRDSTKLYPNTDNPKIDLLIGLANVLEWSIDDVVEYIWNGDTEDRAQPDADFEALDAQAREAHIAGRYMEMVEIARRMYAAATTPEQRARACNREHGGWDGLGRYTKALEAACRGLREGPIPTERQHQLQVNLANTHYTLWELSAAIAHANVIVEWYQRSAPRTPNQQKRQAFALYVRGHSYRRLAGQQNEDRQHYCQMAKKDLERSMRLYNRMAREQDDQRLSGIANTCRGGLIEIAVELGEQSAAAAVDELIDGLDAVIDPTQAPAGDWLESYGWWSVFGANIALRHLESRALQQAMAVFTNKALEIAERMDNWALRERVFTMQYALHEKLIDTTGLELPFVVDDEDRRLITGTMGRFPAFRNTGWRILRAARVVDTAERN